MISRCMISAGKKIIKHKVAYTKEKEFCYLLFGLDCHLNNYIVNTCIKNKIKLTEIVVICNYLLEFCRDLMLAGTQQSVELKLALDQEQLKSKKLEESMRKLDEEMKRTDELLYQMIPKQVADRLRNGESPIDTCEVRLIRVEGNFFPFCSSMLLIVVVRWKIPQKQSQNLEIVYYLKYKKNKS